MCTEDSESSVERATLTPISGHDLLMKRDRHAWLTHHLKWVMPYLCHGNWS